MKTQKDTEEDKYLRAKKRVTQIKHFYRHLIVYLLVNAFITLTIVLRNIYDDGEHLMEAFRHFETFAVWIFWGIGLATHGIKVIIIPYLFGKDWEKRQIEKVMEKDLNQYKSFQ